MGKNRGKNRKNNRGKKEGKAAASGSGVLREVLPEEKEARRRFLQESQASHEELIAKLQRRMKEREEVRKRMEEVRERVIPTLKALDSLIEEISSSAEEIGRATARLSSLNDSLKSREENFEDLMYLVEYSDRIREDVAVKVGGVDYRWRHLSEELFFEALEFECNVWISDGATYHKKVKDCLKDMGMTLEQWEIASQ